MISREILSLIRKRLTDEKAIIIIGPRQAGKSTLLQQLSPYFLGPVTWWNGDDTDIRNILAEPNVGLLKSILGKTRTLVLDEAQRIANIGLLIKIIVDQIKDVKVVATGSSSFELANFINEPLTGRKWEFHLYPFSYSEMASHLGSLEERRKLKHRLVYGYYPEVINNAGEEEIRLKLISDSYLYKDILTWERIQKPEKMERLVQALAFQVGNEVSYNELGQICGLDNETTEKYISLLSKTFIIFRLGSLSRNLRNELKKSRKYYFYDNGLRNAVINQFNPIELRADAGALWENFLISERLKFQTYRQINCNRYFWRTHAQQEIDYVEERNGKMQAYEFKWGTKAKKKFPKTFLEAYSPTNSKVLTPDNYMEFILDFE